MGIVVAIVLALVMAPFQLWCSWRHRKHWRVDAFGWAWYCGRDGLSHDFSEADVHKLVGMYKDAAEKAVSDLL